MRRSILTAFLLCLGSIALFAENPLFKPGQKLIYKVDGSFGTYEFSVKPAETKPDLVFDWYMTHESDMYGSVVIKKDALAKATKQKNTFTASADAYRQDVLSDMTTVVISREVFKSLKAGKPTTMNTGSGDKTFRMKETQSFTFEMDGAEKKEKVIYIESEDGSEKFWVMDNELPLILKMQLNFIIELQEVVTIEPITDLGGLVGQLITSPPAQSLLNRTKSSCWMEIEDLSTDTEPSLYREYFCPTEGIRVKTHNHVINQVLVYRQGAEHEDRYWKQGEAIKLPGGITPQMTRGEIEKILGKPVEGNNLPDLCSYPDHNLFVYYEMVDPDGMEVSPADKVWFLEMGSD